MNYEEKYKEMKKRVLAIGQGYVKEVDYSSPRSIAEYIDPELRESEDERIRKEIIQSIKNNMCVIHKEKCLDWLEKQSEQGNNEDEAILHRFSFYSYKDEPNILYLAGLYVNDEYRNKGIGTKILKIADEVAVSMKCSSILLKTEIGSNAERLYKNNGYSVFRREENQVWLEKQGSQNLANSAKTCKEEQKPIQETEPFEAEHGKYYYCIKDYFCCGKKQASKGDVVQALRGLPIMGLKDASEYFLPVNFIKCNSAWSEEDEKILKELVEEVKDQLDSVPSPDCMDKEDEKVLKQLNKWMNWLKSLKDRVQPKQEWSEEDEHCIELLLPIIDSSSLIPKNRKRCKEFLKSLKERYTWKPSDEQIKTLEYYMNALNCNEHKEVLFGLYEQLKFLKERMKGE